ncbi:MAG: hypothetical protein KF820_03590 [Candidatus Paracaedibacteraceae bacterium]|nr:hypothetical protein [Candidatus Paracaedibacteraceae bacterium]
MRLFLSFVVVLSLASAHDDSRNYIDAGRFEDLQEVTYDNDGNMLLLVQTDPSSATSSVDLQIIEETNNEVKKIEQELADLLEIQKMLHEQINLDGEKLSLAEQHVETTQVQAIDAAEQLKQADELNEKNMFLSLFLKGGVPLSVGAGVGAAGFFSTKAIVLAAAPALATTAAPIIIPTALALAAGGATLTASNFLMKKLCDKAR